MRHGSLFSGIGGFDLAAEWMGWENVFQVEWDKYCQKVLTKNFPNVKKYGDIKEFDGKKYKGSIDILSGGFPCQPFSIAGKSKGSDDDRHLWPQYLRIIREIQPPFVVGENVPGIIEMELDNIIADMESEGYSTEQFDIPAYAIWGLHSRRRIWIICYSKNYRQQHPVNSKDKGLSNERHNKEVSIKRGIACDKERFLKQIRTSEFIRTSNGLPHRMDRIKALGNSIVPQIAFQIFKAIEEYSLTQDTQ